MMRDLGLLGVITAEILVSSGLGVALGYYLWAKQGWPWWILLVTSTLGLTVTFYRLYWVFQRTANRKE